MTQSTALIQALKKALKNQGLTYADVARKLGMSEANVKRMFSEQRFYLDVFEQVCRFAGMDLSDLAKEVDAAHHNLEQLSEAQEQLLISDDKLLLTAFLVVNGVNYADILTHYAISETQATLYFTQLDKLKIIELLPGNRVKLLISPNFAWRSNGPIQQYFNQHLKQDFLSYTFNQSGETLQFLSGVMSPKSRDMLVAKLKQVCNEFIAINKHENKLPFKERNVTGMLVGIRAWTPKVFDTLRK